MDLNHRPRRYQRRALTNWATRTYYPWCQKTMNFYALSGAEAHVEVYEILTVLKVWRIPESNWWPSACKADALNQLSQFPICLKQKTPRDYPGVSFEYYDSLFTIIFFDTTGHSNITLIRPFWTDNKGHCFMWWMCHWKLICFFCLISFSTTNVYISIEKNKKIKKYL